jgi:hypothetical protein
MHDDEVMMMNDIRNMKSTEIMDDIRTTDEIMDDMDIIKNHSDPSDFLVIKQVSCHSDRSGGISFNQDI